MNEDKMRAALLIADDFVSKELHQRETGGDSDYVQEARDVLEAIREALQ